MGGGGGAVVMRTLAPAEISHMAGMCKVGTFDPQMAEQL